MGFNYYETEKGKPLKLWDTHEPFEPVAMEQLQNVAKLPFIYSHVAGMPDVHWGKGATIGSVIATKSAIVPAAVGVDLGCGMMALQTTLTADQLPDNLHPIRTAIEMAVPHGRTAYGGRNDRGSWGNVPKQLLPIWKKLEGRYQAIIGKHPSAGSVKRETHLGTLGSGNHFIEVCLDEKDRVWL